MDELAALRMQIEWGADEALDDVPHDRFVTTVRSGPPAPVLTSTASRLSRLAPVLAAGNHTHVGTTPDLAGLRQALDAFHACPLRATASSTVAPSGNPASGLILVAEAPGADDDRAGQAFSGPPGERLDRVLGSAGLSRADLLLTYLIPWRPPGGRPPNEAELAQCLPFLHRLLALTRPRHLVLLGAAPLRTLTGTADSLRKARGKWTSVTLPGLDAAIPALPMLSPDLWLSSPLNKQTIWADLVLLKEALAQS